MSPHKTKMAATVEQINRWHKQTRFGISENSLDDLLDYYISSSVTISASRVLMPIVRYAMVIRLLAKYVSMKLLMMVCGI